jgi:carbonic anhydrase
LFDRLQAFGQRAFELLRGDFCLVERLGVDEIANSFGLGEIDASIQEGSHGKFAWLGEPRPCSDAEFDDVAKHNRRTVSGNFDDVVGGVGVRFGEVGYDDFIDACRALLGWTAGGGCPYMIRRGFDQFPEDGPAGLQFVFESQHRGGELACLVSREAHHADPSPAGRRRDGDDCVVEVHGAIVAVTLDAQPAEREKCRVEIEERKLSVADELLKANQDFVKNFDLGDLAVKPRRRVAVLACMDSRILFERCLGLHPGDAHMIRNAGGIATEDALRSLIVSHHLLDAQEFIIINHTDCGLLKVREDELKKRLAEKMGTPFGAPAHFHAFDDLEENVRQQVQRVKSHPWIPKHIPVRGFVYDVKTGALHEVNQ